MLLAILVLHALNIDTTCLPVRVDIAAHFLNPLYALLTHLDHSLSLKLVDLYWSALAHWL